MDGSAKQREIAAYSFLGTDLMRSRAANFSNPSPRPSQGVGEFGRPRYSRKVEIAGSNPAALTITQTTTQQR